MQPPSRAPNQPFAVLGQILFVVAASVAALTLLPDRIWTEPHLYDVAGVVGVIGLWRYGWWLTHFVRAVIFRRFFHPRRRARADALWATGWRPERIHILLTTYREQPETIALVVDALASEIRNLGRPATLWLGSREAADEDAFEAALEAQAGDLEVDLRIIRQTVPGKRAAIGLILRAMSRAGLGERDVVMFMDSDFVVGEGLFQRCLPLFALDLELHALTTDEDVVVEGPGWVRSWLEMRFAQRRLAMQSHALSDRVLTLTGRCSLFRATHIVGEEFIGLVEDDRLDSWLWGDFKFLSGDDKSTWYALLRQGVKMTYVPDATGITIERVEGFGIRRMVENLRRWSGNMLRNGARAIALGPRRMPFFIWWCLIDQRLAMWTMLFGPICAIVGAIAFGWPFLAAYAVYIVLTRLVTAVVLSAYARRFDLNYIWCLYANQIMNASIKVYMIWRLPKQRWANRGNQRAGDRTVSLLGLTRELAAALFTLGSIAALVLAATLATGGGALF
jgi:mannuronan synthase